MKKLILGIVLIAISGVIAWNGAEWADGQDARVVWFGLTSIVTFFFGLIELFLGLDEFNK